jgi:hypothetical protein
MRAALTVLLGVHGALHFLGFLTWWVRTPIHALSGRTLVSLGETTGKLFGLLWLACVLLFLVTVTLRVLQEEGWWRFALAGSVLSQLLIVVAWPDARAGSLVNAVLLVPVLVAAAHARFEARIDREAAAVLAAPRAAEGKTGPVRSAEIAPLPPPVRLWLGRSGVLGRGRVHTVRLRQQGALRTSPEGAWLPATAVQYFTVDPPGFVWKVETTMMRVLPITGRDRLADGQGAMLIKAGSTFAVVDASDEKIALGGMLRYLGELIWFPSAALSRPVAWEPIDRTHARATLRDRGKAVSAEFTFDELGRVLEIRAERYLGGGPDAKLTPWVARCSAWRVVRGVEVPVRGDVTWELATGPFSYYRWEVLDVETNVSTLYPRSSAPTAYGPRGEPRLVAASGGTPF